MQRRFQVTVIGDSENIGANNAIAYDAGKAVAAQGYVLLTGGMEAVMREASRGASETGGFVVSILPGEDVDSGNPFKDVSIATGMGWARNSVNVLSCDAVVVIGGGSGTLCEIAFAWAYNKPVIAFTTAKGWGQKLAGETLDHRRKDRIIPVKTVEEMIYALKEIENRRKIFPDGLNPLVDTKKS